MIIVMIVTPTILSARFCKELDAKGLLSSLGLKTILSQVPIFGDICFSLV